MMPPGEAAVPVPWVRDFADRLQRGDFRRSEFAALDHIFAALNLPPGAIALVFPEEKPPSKIPTGEWQVSAFPCPKEIHAADALEQWVSDISLSLLVGQNLPKDFPALIFQAHGWTYWMWQLFKKSMRPKVVVADYDPSYLPVESVSPGLGSPKWLREAPSLRALERSGQRHGYSLVGAGQTNGRPRAFFVVHELLHHSEQLLPLVTLAKVSTPLFKLPRRRGQAEIVECNYLQPHYLRHLQHLHGISKPVIFECGSRDALDACSLAACFDARVFAFECNPQALALCRENVRLEPRVTLVEQAVWIEDGTIEFFPVEGSQTVTRHPEFSLPGGNIGASSCFQATNDNPLYPETYTQSRIVVSATRLDTFCVARGIQGIDLLCMDLQGAELKAVQSLGDRLAGVRAIISEVTTQVAYEGADTYDRLQAFLTASGFQLVEENLSPEWGFGDAMFVRP